MSIIRIPGDRNIFGNEKADQLAKLGASLDESQAELISCPLRTVNREIYVHFENLAQSRWKSKTSCKITIWLKCDRNRIIDLIGPNLPHLQAKREYGNCLALPL